LIKKRTNWLKIVVLFLGAMLMYACGSTESNPCGNGVVDTGETCDTAIGAGQAGACPTSCTAPNACTTSALQNANTCTAACVDTPIVPCCGNGVVESATGETCDTGISSGTGTCPTTCDDSNDVTTDILVKSGTCQAYCINPECGGNTSDGNCPVGCSPDTDTDCIDLTGTWILRFGTTKGTLTASSFSIPDSTIDQIQRIFINQSGNDLIAHFEICTLTSSGTTDLGTFSVDYSDVLDLFEVSPTDPVFSTAVGSTVGLPDFIVITGWDPSKQPPEALDSDGDQNQGITLVIGVGPQLTLHAYTGLTLTTIIKNATLSDENTIEAGVDFSAVGNIFATDSYPITGDFTVTPDSDAIPVTLVKLDGDVDCATVLTHCANTPCVP
jgi:hypothetical protein